MLLVGTQGRVPTLAVTGVPAGLEAAGRYGASSGEPDDRATDPTAGLGVPPAAVLVGPNGPAALGGWYNARDYDYDGSQVTVGMDDLADLRAPDGGWTCVS